ncbi:MAG TPA: RNA polymerase sigma factor RpoD/SigA [Bacteroidia bacterium]|jgi:RNA polymerase primary sigma factor|nr:MAG: RNA polymerase sigma factor RpoD/SigA [Bacteroidota bacterium]HYG16990.1 RNA polymerase sigma factor RpoD/SigA [Bacteroidia bacterium]
MRQLKISKQFTNRENKSLDKYLNEISKVPMIDAQEEVELARRIREGDQVALEKLVNANLRFVVSVSKQYQNQGLTLGDLINEGNLGLIKAAKRFDETRGFKFISYAVWWIRQSILQALADQSRIVRLPLNKVGSIGRIGNIAAELEQKLEREPTAEEIANALEIPTAEVENALRTSGRHLSIDAPLAEGEDNTLLGVLDNNDEPHPDLHLINESLQKEINRVISTLSEKERDVLKYYYGLDGGPAHTLEDISEKVGLTRERVRQIKEKALRRLRKSSKSKILKSYLG